MIEVERRHVRGMTMYRRVTVGNWVYEFNRSAGTRKLERGK